MVMLVMLVVLAGVGLGARPSLRSDHLGKPRTRAYLNTLPEELLLGLEGDCDAISKLTATQPALRNNKYQTYWFPLDAAPRTALEVALQHLRPLAMVGGAHVGAEWWVQSIEGGPSGKIGFHVDKDEAIASNQHYLAHPEYSSILYLSNTGGSTLIFDQYSPNGNGYEPVKPQEGDLSMPQRNKYVVFNGDLLHGVLPGPSQAQASKRVTFLVNYWDRKPDEPNCLRIDYARAAQHGLSLLSGARIAQLQGLPTPHGATEAVAMPAVDLRLKDANGVKRKRASMPRYTQTKIDLPGGRHQHARIPKPGLLPSGTTARLVWKGDLVLPEAPWLSDPPPSSILKPAKPLKEDHSAFRSRLQASLKWDL